ncbi:hypothetical protein FIV42_20280 [Persicimonas caeni]|uniref:DUF3102 domain-containing protein n=1 Tax=Persicimonas caeni TaxID=2292766 RepID=A0A4Y6PXE1_PERCE|nr:hypothetical protein [Persicimonas caeni]QDG52998.1 hypothetical protein FIV42_20280 [Persicimonas caeni]QED34220.1 hypothetical protein FRD00_20275 [Persicimonas caeni]
MEEFEELSPTERISRLLKTVEAGSKRYHALDAALNYKGSWIDLAGHIKEVEELESWKDWDYSSLNAYCKKELQLSRGEIRKMREGYEWLEKEAPELLAVDESAGDDAAKSARPVPDIDTIDQLAKGYRETRRERIPNDTYQELKQAALRGERSSYQLRREFKDAVPEHKREVKPVNPRKHLKRALKALEKALAEIESDEQAADPELAERARKLRDEMFHLVATKDETE